MLRYRRVCALLPLALADVSDRDLKPVVQLAIAVQCEGKAAGVSGKAALAGLRGSPCDGLASEQLTGLGVDDCPSFVNEVLGWGMELECAVMVGEKVAEACGDSASEAPLEATCRQAVALEVAAWAPTSYERDEEEEDAYSVHALALTTMCRAGAKSLSDGAVEAIGAICAETEADNLQTMGISDDDCRAWAKGFWIDTHTDACVLFALTDGELESPDDVTLDFLQEASGDCFGRLSAEPCVAEMCDESGCTEGLRADRLRLFLDVAKGRKWPRRVRPASFSRAAASVAGALAVVLLAMFLAGRRTKQADLQEEETLISADHLFS